MFIRLFHKITFFLIFCFSLISYCQEVEEVLFKVLDSNSKESISYVTVQFQNSKNGIIGNIDGDFRIPFQYKKEKDILIISCIGYETKNVVLEVSIDKDINVIYLKPKVELLDQVVIKGKKSKDKFSIQTIVKNAIAKIPENYPNVPFSTIIYYRDYHTVDNKYYNVNEAIVKSFDAGFSTDAIMDKYNKAALFKYQENYNFKRDSSLLRAYDGSSKFIKNTLLSGQGGNELGILKIHDPIRNYEQLSFSFVYVFKRKFIDNHEFTNIKTVFYNNEKLYKISFKALDKISGSGHNASGTIYISRNNFKIYRLEYEVFEKENESPLYNITVEYKPKGDKMFLNYITFNNRFISIDDSFFDVISVDYKAGEKSFYISFNTPILKSSVGKRDFRFKYKNQKLFIKKIKIVDSTTVKLELEKWNVPKDLEAGSDYLEYALNNIDYRIKNIYDINNRLIFKAPRIKGNQYRELFVQEVKFIDNKSSRLLYINNNKPLREAPINESNDINKYWLNSPLKTTKN